MLRPMNILVINSGSSSIKFQLIDMRTQQRRCKGLIERIGHNDGVFHFQPEGKEKDSRTLPVPDHKTGIRLIEEILIDPEKGILDSIDEIDAVGHRVVLGGEEVTEAVVIDEKIAGLIDDYSRLAPLHNPPVLMGYRAAAEQFPDVPHVGVFDTGFHATLPEEAYVFPVPYEHYEKYGIRRFGYHGTSHHFVALRAAELLGKPFGETNVITCHLGNGASLTAVKNGKSVDTTLGFGTTGGVPMGTRSGDLDSEVIIYLMENAGMSVDDIRTMVYKQSGLKGISGISNDVRDIERAADGGNERAALALKIYSRQIRKYIAAMAACLDGRLDAVIFTAGVGENEWRSRERICAGLEIIGARLDADKNKDNREESVISTDDSPVQIMIIPTNEELMIAMETEKIVTEKERNG